MRARLLLVLLLLASLGWAAAPERAQVTLLATTDLHGNILPFDYYHNRSSPVGLAKVATLIEGARRTTPDLLLLDCGDTIQGTPLVYHYSRVERRGPHPMIEVMNQLRFDAMTVGNHEFNFGLDVLHQARSESNFPWLGANVVQTESDTPAFQPYLVREVQGVKLGIVGITTPGVPGWEDPENYAGLAFADPVSAARRWVRQLREAEQVDVVVVAMHMGLEEDLATGKPLPGQARRENTALEIAREIEGVDLILMGHTHRHIPALVVGEVVLSQAGRWGDHLVRADLYLERNTDSPWRVVARRVETVPVNDATPADPAVLALAQPYHEATQQWLSRPIGRSAERLSAEDARLRDTAIIDLVQRTMLDAGEADVAFTASFNPSATLPAGDVTIRDLSALYVYENTLVVVEQTGAQVKEALEHSARYFLPYEPGKTPAELQDPQVPGYNFDIAEGVDYTIDLRRPPGDRITGLSYRGQPLRPEQKLRVAINNYRHNGGGGYTMFAQAPVLQRSSREIRNLLIEWVEKHPVIPTEPTGNWRIVPAP